MWRFDMTAEMNQERNTAAQNTDEQQIAIRIIRADLCSQFLNPRLKRFFVDQNFSEDVVVMLHKTHFLVRVVAGLARLSRHLVMHAAAGFVHFRGADDHHRIIKTSGLTIYQSLGTGGFVAADHANGVKLVDMLSDRHQDWHRPERLAAEIGIQSGNHNANATGRELLDDLDNLSVKKLRFVDRNDRGVLFDPA